MSNPEPQEEKKLTHDPRYHWDREEHIIVMDAYLNIDLSFQIKRVKRYKT